ncbi:hypothetical protein [Burkholderia glumae]|nr:hypothetical protein [Burkholderia glumae]
MSIPHSHGRASPTAALRAELSLCGPGPAARPMRAGEHQGVTT